MLAKMLGEGLCKLTTIEYGEAERTKSLAKVPFMDNHEDGGRRAEIQVVRGAKRLIDLNQISHDGVLVEGEWII